jgi:hypothetical protein
MEIRRTELTASETKLTRVNNEAIRHVIEAASLEFIDGADRLWARGLFVQRKILNRVSDGYVHRREMSNVAREDC